MSDVTRILGQIEDGDRQAADELLSVVYDELRKLATARMAGEKPGHTLQATALVHEAYLRLMAAAEPQSWTSRGHFFAAAAEAMRRILVEKARSRSRQKRGGHLDRAEFFEHLAVDDERLEQFLELNEALQELERHDEEAASLIKLRYFGGFSHQEAAESLGMSRGHADRLWAVARAWLKSQLE